MTLNVNLTPKLEALVRQKVAEGLYNNASEVIRDALRRMEAQDRFQSAQIDALKRDSLQAYIRDGLLSGEAGDLDIAAIKRRGRARVAEG